MIYVLPKIESCASEKILEILESIKTQYQISFNGSLPNPGVPSAAWYDDWHFDAEAGTNISITAVPSANLDIAIAVMALIPPPYLLNAQAEGPGGTETASAVVPSTGTWLFSASTCCGSGSGGTYTITINSDKPLTNWVVVNDNDYV